MRGLLPPDAVPWVPEHFYVECGAVLRRWDLNRILTATEIAQAIEALMAWPLRVTQVRGLFGPGAAPVVALEPSLGTSPVLVTRETGRIERDSANENNRDCWVLGGAGHFRQNTQIYEGTNQIQRVVMAKRLLG